jgi:carboxyl-terminal processing protease
MLPAANRASGTTLGFPDVCNTPSGPSTVPIPYVNTADHSQATGFSTVVSVAGSNALHLATSISMTSGDEAGTAHSTTKGSSKFSSGNSVVFLENQPAITLTSPATSNSSNCGSATVTVPGAATVLFTRRPLAAESLVELGDAMTRPPALEARALAPGIVYVPLETIAPATPARFHRAVSAARGVVLDLRGNPGGDLRAMVRLAEELLPAGAVVAHLDGRTLRCRQEGSPTPSLAVLIDGGTASAAEIFAAALRFHGRARLFGERTYGKDEAQRASVDGYTTVARVTAADGASLAGGTEPHAPGGLAEAEAWLSASVT